MSNWWKEGVVYQIYPRSFNDTNGDGVGDIPGIIEKLGYLKDLGVNIIWLSPVYASPNEDNGYDISDYKAINNEYGSMADMDMLIAEAKKLDIKIIMDLVINHTSSEHEWFQKSRKKEAPYDDYYIWRKGKNGKLPNNWTGFFGGDCWEYDMVRDEYYLHLFAKGQPDLNFHNPKVLEEVKDLMRFWLDKGIAGFRCDVINIIYKTSLDDGKKRIALTGLEHYHSQEGNHEVLRTLRKEVLDDYDCFTVGETVFVTPEMGKLLCDSERKELDMIFSFEHMEVDQFFIKWFPRKFRPKKFFEVITKWQNSLEWCANYLENHDQPRSVSRFIKNPEYHDIGAKLLSTLVLTLKGTPFIYQGQEIGMTNFDYTTLEEIEDVETHNVMKTTEKLHFPNWYRWKMIMRASRDHARTPMQWRKEKNGGFTDGDPWLKVNQNYVDINTEMQEEDDKSVLNYYRKLIDFRSKNDILKKGSFKTVKITKNLFVYEREYMDKKLTVMLNFSDSNIKIKCAGNVIMTNYDDAPEGELRAYEAIITDGGIA
ncbi:MAG: alpha-glucosidase [Clostridia bacterium]|nr:alpha-glucosidase [Clostridia bacterium]